VPRQPSVTVAVDGRRTHQTMQGFGVSQRLFDDPHLTNDVADPATGRATLAIPPEAQDEILDRLFVDLKLTRIRPMPTGRGMSPDRKAFDFAWIKNDAHAELVRRAVERGADTFFLSPLTLEEWTSEERPKEYADWAMSVVRRWRELGLELPYYAVVNEPGFRRSGIWPGAFLRDVIKAMGPRLRAEGFATRFVLPDDLNATQAYGRSRVVLADPEAKSYVGALGFHLYDEPLANAAKMKELAEEHGLPLWMTEWSQRDPFAWAATMHQLIADYDVSAVDYMWGFFGQEDAAQLIVVRYDRDRYTGYTPLKHYYVVGQYSRFVRPGARRVRATSTDARVLVSAFRVDGRPVVVAVNDASLRKVTRFEIAGFDGATAVQPVRTSMTEDWRELGPIPLDGAGFAATLPPWSVTTFVVG
jgi:O-glycosyl hydrolase